MADNVRDKPKTLPSVIFQSFWGRRSGKSEELGGAWNKSTLADTREKSKEKMGGDALTSLVATFV